MPWPAGTRARSTASPGFPVATSTVRSPPSSSTSSSEDVSAPVSSVAAPMISPSSSSSLSVEFRCDEISSSRSRVAASVCVSAISNLLSGGRQSLALLGHELLDEVSGDVARAKLLVLQDLLVERNRRLHAAPGDLELVERTRHPVDRTLAIGSPHDQLRDQRVVERADHPTGIAVGVDARPRPARRDVRLEPSRRRREVRVGIFGV